ncbi:zinc finger, c3HC4 type (RING finger) domain-containing protein [Hirsutella rhossiliensis]
MAEPLYHDALADELVVQEVILDSLQGEHFDGAEQERQEARREIARLRALLSQPPGPAQTPNRDSSCDGDGRDDAQAQSRHSLPTSTTPTAAPPARLSASVEPASSRRSSAAFSTPRTLRMDNDIWRSPGARSLPSRKRECESPLLGIARGTAKARRITPTPQSNGFATPQDSASSVIDIIDLTGDDVDYDATCIAQHIKEEKRHEQEMRDRSLAQQLSSQGDPAPVVPSTPAPGSGHSDAFSKIMASQMPNSHGQFVKREDPASRPPQTLPMPGAYDARWDEPYGPNSYNSMPSTAFGGPGQSPFTTTPQAFPHKPLPSSTSFSPGALNQSPGVNGLPFSTPALPSSGSVSLLDAIDKPSMLDYANQLDAEGNPFADRLSSFLDHAYHDPNVSEKELDELLQNIRPDMDIPDKHRDGTPAGLKQSLYHHQELALSWMKKMEEGTNKGGILADDMGLGKTISTLALMLARPAVGRPKTNLIIGPLSLVRQWEEEISKKTKLSHRMSVFVYHNTKAMTDDLLRYDVVLTTYGTIAQELKRLEKFMEDNADRNIDLNDRANALKFPLLHPTKAVFHRVVLDEAQCIKNRKTKTAKACHALKSTYRWCLTGTPMMNGVLELFSLVQFLHIKPYCVWENFRQAFGILCGLKGDAKSVAMSRLRALLKAIMLRRKKDSQLNGKPILNLPSKDESIVYAKLSPDERGFYKQLEQKSQVLFSKYLREGSIGKNYSNILVLLLRMRQACCHPHLNLDVDDATQFGKEKVDEKMVQPIKRLSKATVERIKAIEAFECPICFDAVQSPSFFIPCGHDGCKDCVTRLVDNSAAANLQAGDESDKAKCPVCRGTFDGKKCFTYEAFRSVHMPETMVKQSEPGVEDSSSDDDSKSESEVDTEEVNAKGNLRGFVVEDDDSDHVDHAKSQANKADKTPKKNKKGKKKPADVKPSMLKSLRLEAIKNREAYKRYMRYLRKTWMPAAKVTECMNLLKKIQETGEKTIVFSQWTLLLDLLQVAMWHDKFKDKPERYDGSMSGEDRARAARDFRDRDNVKVMLVSLRAGNAGLNLASANNVIIMDPFWNPYIEMQAVDRAYRIGQKLEVKVYRILTEETVEDRIIALQERKKAIVEAALDETESMKIGRLNVNELKFLFNTRD